METDQLCACLLSPLFTQHDSPSQHPLLLGVPGSQHSRPGTNDESEVMGVTPGLAHENLSLSPCFSAEDSGTLGDGTTTMWKGRWSLNGLGRDCPKQKHTPWSEMSVLYQTTEIWGVICYSSWCHLSSRQLCVPTSPPEELILLCGPITPTETFMTTPGPMLPWGICYTNVFIALCPVAVATHFPDRGGSQVAPDWGWGGRLDLKLLAQQMHWFTASLTGRRVSDTLCKNEKCQLLRFREGAGAPHLTTVVV